MWISRFFAALGSAALLVLVLALSGCDDPPSNVQPAPAASPVPTESLSDEPDGSFAELALFVDVVDGDTIETSEGTVRIIGIDTPESGECGHEEASAAIEELLSPGDEVLLELPEGQNDQDRYGRLIRYVFTEEGVDLGLVQLEAGNAIARYDSTDGYPWHPFEDAYHAAQVATAGPDGSVITTECTNEATPEVDATSDERWWEQYWSCTKLKRNTVGHPKGPFNRDNPAEAEIYDWFANQTGNNGDGDGDGLACE